MIRMKGPPISEAGAEDVIHWVKHLPQPVVVQLEDDGTLSIEANKCEDEALEELTVLKYLLRTRNVYYLRKGEYDVRVVDQNISTAVGA